MGQLIERMALERGHEISARIGSKDTLPALENTDVAIDFSVPESAFRNIRHCLEYGVPVVCGTTGWLEQFDEALELVRKHNGGFIYASNFSLGVNLFFALNARLAEMMGQHQDYRVSMKEIHHTQKLDAPSGTAITLANDILKHQPLNHWQLGPNTSDDALPIEAVREGQVPGTHVVTYNSPIDRIMIMHEAHNREGFALGALTAALWLAGKKGIYTMSDVLNLG